MSITFTYVLSFSFFLECIWNASNRAASHLLHLADNFATSFEDGSSRLVFARFRSDSSPSHWNILTVRVGNQNHEFITISEPSCIKCLFGGMGSMSMSTSTVHYEGYGSNACDQEKLEWFVPNICIPANNELWSRGPCALKPTYLQRAGSVGSYERRLGMFADGWAIRVIIHVKRQ